MKFSILVDLTNYAVKFYDKQNMIYLEFNFRLKYFSNYGYSAGFEEHECLSVCKLPLSIILLFASWKFCLIFFVSNKVFLHVLKHVPCF